MQHILNAENVEAGVEAIRADGADKATVPRAEPKVRFLDDFRTENYFTVLAISNI